MPTIELSYGRGAIKCDYDATRFDVLAANEAASHPLSDVEIGAALDAPIDSPPIEDLITPGDSVLIVASDATRATGSAQIINLLVRRLIQNGTEPGEIAIIFATGIHRAVRPDEKAELLTPFIAQRIRTIDHDAYDASQLTQLGVMEGGTPIEVNRALKEFAKVILTGAVGFHYFAGFTGGRKSICPGLAAAQTIEATHMLALDFERGGRRGGVGSGLLNGNAVSEECERVAAMIDPAFSINAIVDERGRSEKIFAGPLAKGPRPGLRRLSRRPLAANQGEARGGNSQFRRFALRHQPDSGAQSFGHGCARLRRWRHDYFLG